MNNKRLLSECVMFSLTWIEMRTEGKTGIK